MWKRRPVRPSADCAYCGKEFRTATDDNRFCSQVCYDTARASRIKKRCGICGRDFFTYRCYDSRYKQCSRECSEQRGRNGTCLRCGKTFRYSRTETRSYCSETCRRPPVIKQCQTCGGNFRPTPSVANNRRFCSFRCYRRFTGETSIEKTTRHLLEQSGLEFSPEFNINQRDVFDFYVPSLNLLIECDGDYWHSRPNAKKRDAIKNARARQAGYDVVRFSESVILSESFPTELNSALRLDVDPKTPTQIGS